MNFNQIDANLFTRYYRLHQLAHPEFVLLLAMYHRPLIQAMFLIRNQVYDFELIHCNDNLKESNIDCKTNFCLFFFSWMIIFEYFNYCIFNTEYTNCFTYNGYGSPSTFCRIGLRGIWPLFKSPQILCTDTNAFLLGISLHSRFTWVYGGGRTLGGIAEADSTNA